MCARSISRTGTRAGARVSRTRSTPRPQRGRVLAGTAQMLPRDTGGGVESTRILANAHSAAVKGPQCGAAKPRDLIATAPAEFPRGVAAANPAREGAGACASCGRPSAPVDHDPGRPVGPVTPRSTSAGAVEWRVGVTVRLGPTVITTSGPLHASVGSVASEPEEAGGAGMAHLALTQTDGSNGVATGAARRANL